MLISIRNRNGELLVKDILDIDFDMSIQQEAGRFFVRLNSQYTSDGKYAMREDAENEMLRLANMRNRLEEELGGW